MRPGKSTGEIKPYLHILPAFMAVYIAIGIVSPYISILVRGLGYSPSTVGLLLGIFEAAGIAGPFILGWLVDRWGRYKPGLLICVILMMLPGIPLAETGGGPALSALLLCILAAGVKSSIPLMEAMTTLVVGRDGNYGKFRSFSSLAFIAAVLFFQWFPFLPRNSSLNIGIWISITSAAALVFIIALPSRLSAGPRPPGAGGRPGSLQWLRNPRFILGLLMIALSRIAMSPVLSFLSLYVTEYVHWDAVGLIWAIAAAAETPLIFFSRRIIQYFKSPLKVIYLTGFALILRLLIYAFLPYPPAIVAGQLLHSLCYGLFHPAAVAFISVNTPPEHRAAGMTLYLSLGTGLPAFLGNILGGFVVEYFGYPALYGGYTIFPILAMGVYFIILRGFRERPD